jgi:AbiV family abortive infection protein
MPAAIAECLANAGDLLRGAHALVDRELPRLAYHLAVLALEEIGKASIFGMHSVSARHGRELPPFIAEAAGSHVRKLFWAIWGPSLGQERITVDQIEANRGLAQRLHERRLQTLYVDASAEDGLSVPTGTITDEESRSLIRMVEARLEIEKAYDHESGPSAAAQEQSEWLFQATEDPERRALIMGARSMDRLKELGSVAGWIAWLRETFEKHDTEMREAIEREMRRAPDDPAIARDKWIVTVRLYTESNSIRQKPLNDWNSGIRWIKLRAVSGKKDQLLVDFHVTSETTLDHLWRGGLHISRLFVMALNVGTLGYFWFHPSLDDPSQSGRYYDRVVDLDTNTEVRAKRDPPLRLDFGQRRRVLDERMLRNVLLCTAILVRLHGQRERDVCERYLEGMAHIAKSDIQMSFEPQGVLSFYLCIRTAMAAYGDWDESGPFPPELRRFVQDALPTFETADLEKLIAVGEAMTDGQGIPHPLTMNDVGLMKILCDAYLIRTFRRIEPERLGGVAGVPT